MRKELRYFKLGLFVIISATLLVAAILFFGAAKYFEPKVYVESYFNESVQGLDVGSPVKYRGITIGHVSEIEMISNVYSLSQIKDKEVYNRNIYVEMAITADKVKHFDGESSKSDLHQLVRSGLRVRLTTQGFTGASYLEITFLDPKDNPPERVTWNTQYLYLPSAPSTYTRLTDAISDVLSSLKKVQYEKVFNNIDALAITAKRAIDDSDFPTVGKKLNSALDNLEKTSSSYKSMADELSKIIKSGEIENTLTNINKASSRISSITEQADTTLEELATTVSHTNEMISGYREQISTILDNTESTTSNLKSFTNNAKEHPSQMIWGSPPPALNPKSIN